MPEGAGAPSSSQRRASALEAVHSWLSHVGGSARVLGPDELRDYASREATAGWRLEVEFPDRRRRLDLLADDRFPRGPLRVALVDRPDFLTWPHVERDGVLCLLPDHAAVDVSNPAGVAATVLAESCQLIEDSVAGANEEDFRSEFQSYWSWSASKGAPTIYSLAEPRPPTRLLRVWRGQRFFLVGEDEAALLAWLRHFFRETQGQPKRTTDPAVLLWLERPLLPREYPRSAADLRSIARARTAGGADILEHLAANSLSKIVALLGAPTTNGPSLAGVTVSAPRGDRPGGRAVSDPLTRGFRLGKVPPEVVSARFLGATSVLRSSVDRVDAAWVHGRGQDPRLPRLRAATVGILGCGSIGAAVTLVLASAGVGRFILIDPDTLVWANLSRHPLGAGSVGLYKAKALASRLTADYPHLLSVEAHARRWEDAAPDLLNSCDVIVSAIGEWTSEGSLNEWHVAQGRMRPIIYGWTEPHGCAGHAVAIVRQGGCFQCGLTETGVPRLHVTYWPAGPTFRQEPACGGVYQPFGPVELGHVIALISETALDCILGTISTSTHRVWAARRSLLDSVGGAWTPEWSAIAGDRLQGGFVEERPWPVSDTCIECRSEAA